MAVFVGVATAILYVNMQSTRNVWANFRTTTVSNAAEHSTHAEALHADALDKKRKEREGDKKGEDSVEIKGVNTKIWMRA